MEYQHNFHENILSEMENKKIVHENRFSELEIKALDLISLAQKNSDEISEEEKETYRSLCSSTEGVLSLIQLQNFSQRAEFSDENRNSNNSPESKQEYSDEIGNYTTLPIDSVENENGSSKISQSENRLSSSFSEIFRASTSELNETENSKNNISFDDLILNLTEKPEDSGTRINATQKASRARILLNFIERGLKIHLQDPLGHKFFQQFLAENKIDFYLEFYDQIEKLNMMNDEDEAKSKIMEIYKEFIAVGIINFPDDEVMCIDKNISAEKWKKKNFDKCRGFILFEMEKFSVQYTKSSQFLEFVREKLKYPSI